MTTTTTEFYTEPECDKFVTVMVALTKMEASVFYRWRQLRKKGVKRVMFELNGDTLNLLVIMGEPETLHVQSEKPS